MTATQLEEESLRYITWDEFIKHSSFESCWILVNNKIYDVTNYKKHPGQFDILVGSSMKDATHSFNTVNHSPGAVKGMKRFYIGEFDQWTMPQGS
jgi:cytochrome b involved in lipid metabolism